VFVDFERLDRLSSIYKLISYARLSLDRLCPHSRIYLIMPIEAVDSPLNHYRLDVRNTSISTSSTDSHVHKSRLSLFVHCLTSELSIGVKSS